TRNKIAPSYGRAVCYAKDAMTGLRLMNQLMDPSERETTLQANTHTDSEQPALAVIEALPPMTQVRSAKVRVDLPIPPAPYLDRKLRDVPQLTEIWSYINPFMLYGRHLGYKGRFEQDLADHNEKALELFQNMEALKEEAARFMKVKAVWQFFEAERDGNAIHLFAPGGSSPIRTFQFGRQRRQDGLCLSDYILDPVDGQRDHLAFFVVTAGAGIRGKSEQWKQAGEYFKAHALQALAIETAESCAEWLQRRIREDWGFPAPPPTPMQ